VAVEFGEVDEFVPEATGDAGEAQRARQEAPPIAAAPAEPDPGPEPAEAEREAEQVVAASEPTEPEAEASDYELPRPQAAGNEAAEPDFDGAAPEADGEEPHAGAGRRREAEPAEA
jgi:hypothetical protein